MSEFHRITVEHWQHVLGIVSLMLFAFTFAFVLIRAALMPRPKLTRLENLPFNGDNDHE